VGRTVRARVNGTTLTWREAGEGAALLLLLHGFPFDSRLWEPQLAALPPGWRGIAPDLRGFGGSEAGGLPLTMEQHARDSLALLDHLGVTRAVVCGLSMGGYVAFGLWRKAAERLRGLVLADTRPEADSEAARGGRQQMLDLLARDGVPAAAESMLPRLLGQSSLDSRPQVVERVRRLAVAQSPAGIGPAIVRLMSRPDSTPLLPQIDRPVLVVVGEEDAITGTDVAMQMHGQMAAAELALIRHAGHLSNLEQPEAFTAALDRFLVTRFRR
jgi:pimeloyl-ACP methyl ester carboxylesterase